METPQSNPTTTLQSTLSSPTSTPQSNNNAPFTDLFIDNQIRVAGTSLNPLFVASDVAKKIGDTNLDRALKRLNPNHVIKQKYTTTQNKIIEMNFLTENGLYRYLMKSDRKEAEPFQDWVCDRLRDLRLQLIKTKDLELKIANSNLNLANLRIEEIEWDFYGALPATYDAAPLDSCSEGMANFYITRYFSLTTRDKTPTVKQLSRRHISQETMDEIYKLSWYHWTQGKYYQDDFELELWKILDKIFLVPQNARK